MKKMSESLYFCLLSLSFFGLGSGSVYYPRKCHHDYQKISFSDLNCPTSIDEYKSKKPTFLSNCRYEFSMINPIHTPYLITGLICRTYRLSSVCKSNWLGGTTIYHKRQIWESSLSLCEDGVLRYRNGLTTSPSYPSPICKWWSENSNSTLWTSIDYFDVQFNPLKNGYESIVFPGGLCKNPPCRLASGSGYWVLKRDVLPCSSFLPILVNIEEDLNSSCSIATDSKIHSPHLSARSLLGSCLSEYCGSPGVKLYSGEWVGFNRSLHTDSFRNFPICNDSEKEQTGVQSLLGAIDVSLLWLNQVRTYRDCIEYRNTIMANLSLPFIDWNHFISVKNGSGSIFRSTSKGLFYCKGEYIMSSAVDYSRMLNDKTKLGLGVELKYWEPVGEFLLGPNGLFYINNTVLNPSVDLDGSQSLREEIRKNLLKIKKHHIQYREEEFRESIVWSTDRGDKNSDLQKFFEEITTYIQFHSLPWILLCCVLAFALAIKMVMLHFHRRVRRVSIFYPE